MQSPLLVKIVDERLATPGIHHRDQIF